MSSSDPPPEKPERRIRVGLPGGAVHEFSLDPALPVSTLVTHIINAENLDPSAVRVRIISSGKLVEDHSVPLQSVLNQGSFLHAALSEPPAEPDPEDEEANGGESLMLSAVDANGEVRILIPNLTPQGLARLAQAGLSEEEISVIRRQFGILRREARGNDGGSASGNEGREEEVEWLREVAEEEGEERRTRREHRFVLATGAEGTNGDFLMGCIFGYLLGIIVLVLLLDNNATRRWRVGIVAGVATNCAFGILRTSLYFQEPLAAP